MKVRQLKRILVPISLAGDGESAFRQALFFRRKLSSRITLLHVIPPSFRVANVIRTDLDKGLQARAMVRLVRFVKIHFKGKVPDNMELRVVIGHHVSSINQIAKQEKFDLIIINKNNKRQGIVDQFRKHSAERIVGESICPVLTVKHQWTNRGVRDILVPIDIVRKSRDLLEWAIFLGQMLNARIHLLTALMVKIELERSLAYKKAYLMKEIIEKEGLECKVSIEVRNAENRLEALLMGAKDQVADLILVQGHQEMMFSDGQAEQLHTEFLHKSVKPVMCLGIEMETIFTDLFKSRDTNKVRSVNKDFSKGSQQLKQTTNQ